MDPVTSGSVAPQQRVIGAVVLAMAVVVGCSSTGGGASTVPSIASTSAPAPTTAAASVGATQSGAGNSITVAGPLTGDLDQASIAHCSAVATPKAQHQIVLVGTLAGVTYSLSILYHGDGATVSVGAATAADPNDAVFFKQETPPGGKQWSANPPNSLGENGRGSVTVTVDTAHGTGSVHGTLADAYTTTPGPDLKVDATFACPPGV